jgi:hypothetical protein
MFVKIVEIDPASGRILDVPETAYDCVKYRFYEDPGQEEGRHTVLLDLELSSREIRTRVINCETEMVYIMNNNGATIDRKAW